MHYTEHDLASALSLYEAIIASHGSAPEADYSRVQIRNIVNTVVPKAALVEAQIALARVHLTA